MIATILGTSSRSTFKDLVMEVLRENYYMIFQVFRKYVVICSAIHSKKAFIGMKGFVKVMLPHHYFKLPFRVSSNRITVIGKDGYK